MFARSVSPRGDRGLLAAVLLVQLLADPLVGAEPLRSTPSAAGPLPPSLAAAFAPPGEWAGRTSELRSPLLFHDGTPVRTAADWRRRREEILARWHLELGPWPPLDERPRVEVETTMRRVDDALTQHHIRFDWLPGQATDGYLLVPDAPGPHPAVLVVYYEPETAIGQGKPLRDFALQLSRRGFVTLSIGNRAGSLAQTYGLFHPSLEQAELQPLSAMACAAAQAYYVLAARPEVDAARIGVMGHSYGGKWALFASCLFDRFAAAAWSDPGIVFDEANGSVNYWEPWYLGYRPGPWRPRGPLSPEHPAVGAYRRLVRAGLDLHELHALMAPRPLLVSGGSVDGPHRWPALQHAIAVNSLLGYERRVAMTNRATHDPTDDSNVQIADFFVWSLGPVTSTVDDR